MALDVAMVAAIKELNKSLGLAIDKQSSKLSQILEKDRKGGAERKRAAEDVRAQKAFKSVESAHKELRNIIKNQGKTLDGMRQQTEYASRLLDDTIQGAESLKELDKVVDDVRKSLASSSNAIVTEWSKGIESLEDVLRMEDLVLNFNNLREELLSSTDSIESLDAAIGNLRDFELEMGMNFEEMGLDLDRYHELRVKQMQDELSLTKSELDELNQMDKALDQVQHASLGVAEAFGQVALETDRYNKAQGKLKQGTLAVLAALGHLGKELYTGAMTAAKYGVEMELVRSRRLGMESAELSELQGLYKQTALATGGMDVWTNSLVNATDPTSAAGQDLILLAGGLKEATKAAAAATQNVVSFGQKLKPEELAALRDNEINQAKRWNRATGMTIDQFNDMTSSLLQDNDIRANLMRMNEKERAAQFESIRARILENKQLGLSTEQAIAVTKTFQAMARESPIERLKKAAKMQAMAGAMGMGEQGAAIAAFQRAGSRATPEQRKAAEEAGIKLADAYQSKLGEGMSSEIMYSQLAAATGTEELLGSDGPLAAASMEVGKKIDDLPESIWNAPSNPFGAIGEVLGISSNHLAMIANTVGQTLAFLGGPGGSLIAGLVGGLGTLLGSSLLGGGDRGILSKVGGLVKGAGAALGAGGGVLAAGAGGYALGTAAWENMGDENQEWVSDKVGRAVDGFLSLFSDEADQRLQMYEQGKQASITEPTAIKQAAQIQPIDYVQAANNLAQRASDLNVSAGLEDDAKKKADLERQVVELNAKALSQIDKITEAQLESAKAQGQVSGLLAAILDKTEEGTNYTKKTADAVRSRSGLNTVQSPTNIG